ncbi:hypothetical protein QWI17_20035 [Gilvimarinus sp. SDUM040013]|uniref:SMODS-associating 2TM beta-strand rich effector domain-containing protein n=1 Tax=Gilvimarinus gilvus TaxID=3058038 RepID=A0ABU4S054_9GAMM|nr:hypothetical protein [Gilvimarinus sp. SDUM040013]MDO3388146.1 hypothetical protein [Gilvimarinus sp. SDUM040013]MDX6850279.1 hypothetical protein [Gilvimarinus sp. SDUM040013]
MALDGQNGDGPGSKYQWSDVISWVAKRTTWIILVGVGFIYLAQTSELESSFLGWLPQLLGTVGGTLVTAAVLGFAISDGEYVKLLREHVAQAIFTPQHYSSKGELVTRWRDITEYLLSGVLPFSSKDAALEIQRSYISAKNDYHFEEVEISIDILIDPSGTKAKIIQESRSRLVISPSCEKPIINQKITMVEGSSANLNCLEINGKAIDIEKCFEPCEDEPGAYKLIYEIPKEQILMNSGDDRYCTYKRVYCMEQDLQQEPFLATNIKRYVKGLTVESKIRVEGGGEEAGDSPYKLHFKRFGMNGNKSLKPYRSNGKTKWEVAGIGDLLLPGESYIIIIIKS